MDLTEDETALRERNRLPDDEDAGGPDELPFEVGEIVGRAFSRDHSRLADLLFGPTSASPTARPRPGSPGPAAPVPRHPELLEVSVRGEDGGTALVAVRWGLQVLRGTSSPVAAGAGRHLAVARAMVDALRLVIPGLRLESLTVAPSPDEGEVVTAVVSAPGHLVSGAAAADRGSAEWAGARAVLGAVAGHDGDGWSEGGAPTRARPPSGARSTPPAAASG